MKIEGQRIAVDLTAQVANEVAKTSQEKSTQRTTVQAQREESPKPQAHKSEKDIELAASVLNETMKICNYHLEFKVHKESGRMQVKVVDSDSKKVIREIPPEQILDCSARIRELIDNMAGVLLDERA